MENSKSKCLQEWGKELLQQFPDGLADEPDFELDGAARLAWFSKGYSVGVRWASEIGIGGKVFLGKTYEDPEALDDAGKAEFARSAFNLGRVYSEMAKVEANKAAEQEAEQRKAIADVDRQVETLSKEIASINSREELRIRIARAKEGSVAARACGKSVEDYSNSRQINALQERLIAIEAQEARRALSGWWITAIGTLAGIAGLALGYIAASSS